jgi:hypothetical protein
MYSKLIYSYFMRYKYFNYVTYSRSKNGVQEHEPAAPN